MAAVELIRPTDLLLPPPTSFLSLDPYRTRPRLMREIASPAETIGISVIIPCLNEAKTVRKTLIETERTVREIFGDSFEILVVDDGSTDGTSAVVEAASHEISHVRLITLPSNRGKGNAVRTAFGVARGEMVCFLDGDFDIHPKHIAPLVRVLQESHVSVVIGSKRHPDSQIDYPWQRRILSTGYEAFVRILFGLRIRDTQAGIKVFRREVLDSVFSDGLVKRYAFDAELLVLAHLEGFRILEAPIQMDAWDQIGSGVKLREVVRMFWDTLGVFYRLRVTGHYGPTGAHGSAEEAS